MLFRQQRTALIVDSSPTILYYHRILMKRMKYKVLSASTPDDAWRIMQRTVPTVVLTGLTFANEKSLDFIQKIKSSPRGEGVPVIALTSLEDVESRADCLIAGCAACLSKPVEPACLFWTVQDITEHAPRQFVRIKTSLKAIVGDGSSSHPAEWTDYVTNLSEGGIYLRTLSKRSRGDLIPVSIFINKREIKSKMVMLYRNAMDEGPFEESGMGLKFVDISEEDRSVLRKFIRQQLVAEIDIGLHEKEAA